MESGWLWALAIGLVITSGTWNAYAGDSPKQLSRCDTSEVSTALNIPSTSAEFNVRDALAVLYPDAEIMIRDPADIFSPGRSGAKTIVILVSAPFAQGGLQKQLLLISSPAKAMSMEGCHGCQAPISGGVFALRDNAWHVEFHAPVLDHLGEWGQAPVGKFVRMGPENYGAVFLDSWSGMGSSTTTFILYGYVSGTLRKLLTLKDVRSCGENVDGTKSWCKEITYCFVPGANPEIYDLWLETRGTDYQGGEVVKGDEDKLCTFDGREYACEVQPSAAR